eukprot:TRINITY_DN9763_c0_g2_i1.p1 TRINITY_DN9763_c0_g2~~TRINITY_DN9763_c0_g2_i1.p1  ORF type:complete len:127 (+),score=5.47 TRINITY_DN9763_c0_g2_i1:262-642(+)
MLRGARNDVQDDSQSGGLEQCPAGSPQEAIGGGVPPTVDAHLTYFPQSVAQLDRSARRPLLRPTRLQLTCSSGLGRCQLRHSAAGPVELPSGTPSGTPPDTPSGILAPRLELSGNPSGIPSSSQSI